MNRTKIPLVRNVYEPGFNKHITTACVKCRKKRRKCSGGTPCFSCTGTGDECVYDYTDLRKQRHQRNAVNQPLHQIGISPASIVTTSDSKDSLLLDQRRDDAVRGDATDPSHVFNGQPQSSANDRDANHDPSSQTFNLMQKASQSFSVNETEALHEDTAAFTYGRRAKVRRLVSKSRIRLDIDPGSPVCSMKEMQGKFGIRAAELGRGNARYHKMISKSTSESQTVHSVGFYTSESTHVSNERQTYQIIWPIRRKRYVGPGYTRTFGNLPFSSSIQANGYPADVQARQSLNFRAPEHLIVPLTCMDDSPLGRTFTDFQRLVRGLTANGTPASEVSEHGLIDVTLFFRPRLPEDPINASSWASEMLRSFRGTFSDALLLACAVCVGSLMRWVLMPTPENYSSLPPMMRPTPQQRSIPHPPWVDLMVFPSFRDSLVNKLRDWAEPCVTARWEFLWPGNLEEALIRDLEKHRTFLSSAFATYAADPKNYIMQRSILDTFPEVQGTEINISQA